MPTSSISSPAEYGRRRINSLGGAAEASIRSRRNAVSEWHLVLGAWSKLPDVARAPVLELLGMEGRLLDAQTTEVAVGEAGAIEAVEVEDEVDDAGLRLMR